MYFIELGFGHSHNIQAQYKICCHCSQSEKGVAKASNDSTESSA